MAADRGIRIRINRQRVDALVEICEEMLEEFIPVNEHQQLLKEYLGDLRQQLCDMIKRDQQNYLLLLTSTEAMAFYQLWTMLDISHDRYACLIVGNLLKKMNGLAA